MGGGGRGTRGGDSGAPRHNVGQRVLDLLAQMLKRSWHREGLTLAVPRTLEHLREQVENALAHVVAGGPGIPTPGAPAPPTHGATVPVPLPPPFLLLLMDGH